MSIRNCTFIRAVAHPPLTNSTVAPLCETCLIFHWAGDCPAPCASEWPCSLKLFSIDPWPCAKCFSATQNKLASGPWDLPIFRKSFILHSRMRFPNVGLLPRQRPRPAPIICTNCRDANNPFTPHRTLHGPRLVYSVCRYKSFSTWSSASYPKKIKLPFLCLKILIHN